MDSILQSSIPGLGCGAPVEWADIQEGETVVALGPCAGMDIFLAANRVGKSVNVIGIDTTDEILQKARNNAKDKVYQNKPLNTFFISDRRSLEFF